jgi:hypothetical protein
MKAAGTEPLDGRPHVRLEMTTAEGGADTWYVDAESARVTRIDLTLPMSQDTVGVWGFPEEMDATVLFGDWRRVDGVEWPHSRKVRTGTMTVDSVVTRVEQGGKVEAAHIDPPESVRKLAAAGPRPVGAGVEIVEREGRAARPWPACRSCARMAPTARRSTSKRASRSRNRSRRKAV